MTIYEISEKYNIPMALLQQYESWKLCSSEKKIAGQWQYDDEDLENLSLIMTLHNIGFSCEEIENYMRLQFSDCCQNQQKIAILNKKRELTLDQIHSLEKQLEQLDYLRYTLCNPKA